MDYNFLQSPIYQEALEQVNFIMDGASERQLEIFGQTWFTKHFDMNPYARTESEFSAILGQLHATPAASTINEFSARPIRSLEGFGRVKAEMLTAAHTYKLEAEDLRAIALYQKMWPEAKDRQKVLDYIVDKLLNVRAKAIKGVLERLDILTLTLLSNDGVFTYTKDNDPGSPYIGTQVEFGWDETHSYKAATSSDVWTAANKSTVNVLEDLMAIRDAAAANGVVFEKMLLRQEQLMYMLTTDKLKLYINGTDRASRPIGVSDVKSIFAEFGIPEFEIVQHISTVEDKGGKVVNQWQPWTLGKILFAPSDKFGTIEHQVTDADLLGRDKDVNYSKYNQIEVTSWQQGVKENTNHTEFVSAALTSTPVVSVIKDMYAFDALHYQGE